MPPSYRERLRVEGLALAAGAALAALILLITVTGSRSSLTRTLIIVAVVLLLLAWLGPRSVHLALGRATQLFTPDLGGGAPRAPWQLLMLVAAATAIVARLGGGANGLRLDLILLLVGLCQAFVLERIVAVNEGQTRRRYFRVEGSRMFGATRIGFVQRRQPADRPLGTAKSSRLPRWDRSSEPQPPSPSSPPP